MGHFAAAKIAEVDDTRFKVPRQRDEHEPNAHGDAEVRDDHQEAAGPTTPAGGSKNSILFDIGVGSPLAQADEDM